jgi:hypothetical protein
MRLGLRRRRRYLDEAETQEWVQAQIQRLMGETYVFWERGEHGPLRAERRRLCLVSRDRQAAAVTSAAVRQQCTSQTRRVLE